MKKNPLILLFIILCLFLTLSCSGNGESNVKFGSKNQILHLGNGGEPQDIDPHITTGMPEFHIQMAIFEGLLAKDPKTLEPIAGAAESWLISDDNKTYTFKLREYAKWSNGDPVTASDFVYSWQRALMPALGNQYAYSLHLIKNAYDFNTGKINDFSKVGVTAVDKHTLKVELNSPTPYFLQLLDHHSMYPVHQATIEKFGKIDERGSQWSRAENFVGNGPFTIKEWTLNKALIVEKNPLYWDANTVKLNEIHFHPVQKTTIEERMFRAGQLHVTSIVPEEKIAKYKRDRPELLQIHPYFGTYFYRFNTSKPPLNNPKVRLALAMCIDRKKIVEKITKGEQTPAYTLTPPDVLGYTADASIPFDIEKAKALLTEAGYPNGEGLPTLEILYNTSEGHRKIALAIQQMWKLALNVNVSLLNQDWKVYLDTERTMNYQISRASWIGDYLDPNTFLDMFITDGGNNKTGWSNKRYDELISLAATSPDSNTRYAYFKEAERILMNEVPIVPIYTYTRNFLIAPDVKGWFPNILDYHPYKYVYLEPQK